MAGRPDKFVNEGAEGITVKPKKIAGASRLASKKVRRLATGVSLLEKEILRPGRYVDEDGVEFDLTAEEIAAFVDGTNQLLGIPFRVNGFPDHNTNSSTTKLGRWVKVWVDHKGSARGHFEPNSAASETIAMDNDCSAVLVNGLNLGAVHIEAAMPRIDIVPQGAVLALQPFTRVAALATGIKAERIRCCSRKEIPMKSRLASILAHAMGMDATDDEEGVIAALSSHLMTSRKLATEGLELGDEDMAAALKELLAGVEDLAETADAVEDSVETDEPAEDAAIDGIEDAMEDEGSVAEELEMSAPAPKSRALASSAADAPQESAVEKDLRAQLASMQRRELDEIVGKVRRLSAKTSPIETKSIAAIRTGYEEDAKAHGHEKALARATHLLSLHLQLAAAKAKPAAKPAQRKLATPPGKKVEAPVTPENNPLLALRGGPHRPNANGAAAN